MDHFFFLILSRVAEDARLLKAFTALRLLFSRSAFLCCLPWLRGGRTGTVANAGPLPTPFPRDFLGGQAMLFGLFTMCMVCDQWEVVSTNQTQIDRLKGESHTQPSLEIK